MKNAVCCVNSGLGKPMIALCPHVMEITSYRASTLDYHIMAKSNACVHERHLHWEAKQTKQPRNEPK